MKSHIEVKIKTKSQYFNAEIWEEDYPSDKADVYKLESAIIGRLVILLKASGLPKSSFSYPVSPLCLETCLNNSATIL